MRKTDSIKFEAKKREILEAAARCFRRDGLKGASIGKICAEAGISPGHLYHYFASKLQIVEEIAGLYLQRINASNGTDEPASIFDFIDAELRRSGAIEGIGDCTVLFDVFAEAPRNSSVANILKAGSVSTVAIISEMVRNGQAQRQIDGTLNAEHISAAVLAVLDGALAMPVRDPDAPVDAVRAILLAMVHQFLTCPAAGLHID